MISTLTSFVYMFGFVSVLESDLVPKDSAYFTGTTCSAVDHKLQTQGPQVTVYESQFDLLIRQAERSSYADEGDDL